DADGAAAGVTADDALVDESAGAPDDGGGAVVAHGDEGREGQRGGVVHGDRRGCGDNRIAAEGLGVVEHDVVGQGGSVEGEAVDDDAGGASDVQIAVDGDVVEIRIVYVEARALEQVDGAAGDRA